MWWQIIHQAGSGKAIDSGVSMGRMGDASPTFLKDKFYDSSI